MKFSRVWAGWLAIVAVLVVALAVPAPAQAQSKPNPNQPRVYLLRGLANIFSLGMDDLAAKMRARGIDASVHSYVDLDTLTRSAIEQATVGKRRPTPVIIIGHSLGADAAVTMGNRVSDAGVPVPLVVTFDPVTPMTASPKIGKVVNYYQAGGSGKPVAGRQVENIDLTGAGALSHFNIEKAPELHNKVMGMIQRPARPRAVAATPKPKPVEAPADAAAAPATPAATPAASPSATPAATPAVAPGATPAATPATQSGAAAPLAGAETASAPSAVPTAPAGTGTSN